MKPRGLRNNNPLNIRRSKDCWMGTAQTQTDKAFVQFESMAYGFRAAWKIMDSYYNRFRQTKKTYSVANIIRRWAPPEDHNDTEAYIRSVVSLTGLGGNERLMPPRTVDGYGRMSLLIMGMACVENGIGMNAVDSEAVCQGYKLAFPDNAAELNRYLLDLDEYADWGPLEDLEDHCLGGYVIRRNSIDSGTHCLGGYVIRRNQ